MSTSSSDRTLSLCQIYAKPASEYRVWSLSFFPTSFTRKIHENNHTHHIMSYLPSTGTSARRAHAFTNHTDTYLEEAEHQHWHVLHKPSRLKTFLDEGWTVATMHHRLKDPAYMLDSLGTPPSPGPLPGTSL